MLSFWCRGRLTGIAVGLKHCPSACPFSGHASRSVSLHPKRISPQQLQWVIDSLVNQDTKQSPPFLVVDLHPHKSPSLIGQLPHNPVVACTVCWCHRLPLLLHFFIAPSNTPVSTCGLCSLWSPGGVCSDHSLRSYLLLNVFLQGVIRHRALMPK